MSAYDVLFQPLQIKNVTVPNRFASSSHQPGYTANGLIAERGIRYEVEKAKGGVSDERMLAVFGRLEAELGDAMRELTLAHDELDAVMNTHMCIPGIDDSHAGNLLHDVHAVVARGRGVGLGQRAPVLRDPGPHPLQAVARGSTPQPPSPPQVPAASGGGGASVFIVVLVA